MEECQWQNESSLKINSQVYLLYGPVYEKAKKKRGIKESKIPKVRYENCNLLCCKKGNSKYLTFPEDIF